MAFPQEFIDKIKDNVDIVELISEYTKLRKVGTNIYEGHCPHPSHKDSTPSFRVWSDSKSWACMGCHNGKKIENNNLYKNYGSDCIAFIRWIEPKYRNWRDAVIYLANKYHIPIPTDKNNYLYKQKKSLAYSLMYNLYGEPLKYLESRGLTIEDCDNWMVGYDGYRIVFPLLDRYRNVLAFTRRWLHIPEGANDKYNNSPNSNIFNKSNYFYGIHNLDNQFNEIRITEGPMDVILANKYGVKNVVATLGTAFTQGHIDLIKHYKKTPVFCLDGDNAGLIAINRAVNLLAKEGIYSKILIIPNNKDLADLSLDLKYDIESYINNNSITYGNFIFKNIFSLYTAKLNELKLNFMPDIINLLNTIPDENEKIILKSYIKNNMDINI